MRYKCTCDPSILDNEALRYKNQVLLELPNGPEHTRRSREGLSALVCIDPCIVGVIEELWDAGIETLGCCCGHNVLPGYVDIYPDQFDKMAEIGYKKMPVNEYGHGSCSFYL